MGRRGPAPVPTKLQLVDGEARPSWANRAEGALDGSRSDAHSEPMAVAPGTSERRTATQPPIQRLAKPLETERSWVPDREAMRAALRVVLDLPIVLPSPAGGGEA
jgi:hypothetical protein